MKGLIAADINDIPLSRHWYIIFEKPGSNGNLCYGNFGYYSYLCHAEFVEDVKELFNDKVSFKAGQVNPVSVKVEIALVTNDGAKY